MKKTIVTLTTGILTFCQVIAQNTSTLKLNESLQSEDEKVLSLRKCATPILSEKFENWMSSYIQKKEQFANEKKVSVVYTIPVVFHIIHSGQAVGTGYNISATRINQQIARLNADYRKTNSDQSTYLTQASFISAASDVEINFCAAKISPSGTVMAEPGIDRIKYSDRGWPAPPYSGSSTSLENTIKPNSIWDPTKYFNVWVTAFSDGTLGYAQFPTVPSGTSPVTDMVGFGGSASTDGVVIDYNATGNTSGAYNLGRTLTHESGHWLGLRHIDGDASCGNDYVTDTPAQNNLSGTCPSSAGAVVSSGCSASPNPPGRMYQNYMDYSDDKCMVLFTAGQKARMQAVMASCTRRNSLNTSLVCGNVSVNDYSSILEFNLFPNPSNGELNVTLDLMNTEDFSISVINTLGQVVSEIKQLQSNGGNIKLDLLSQSRGVYFVTVKTNTSTRTKRLILQ